MIRSYSFKISKIFILCSVFIFFSFASCSATIGMDEPESNNSIIEAKGNISGKVIYSNLENTENGKIVVTLDKTDGLRTISVNKAVINGKIINSARSVIDTVSTLDDGSYSFNNLDPGTYTVYASSSYSKERAVCTNVVVRSAETTVAETLNLTATGSISGRITLDNKKTGNTGFIVFVAGTSFIAMTDDSGSYTISDVPAGNGYQIVATKNGVLHSLSSNIVVRANKTTQNISDNFTSKELQITNQGEKGEKGDKGDTGKDGISIVWLGTFSSHDDIQNPQSLNAYFNITDGCSYIFDGKEWTLLAKSGGNVEKGENGVEGKSIVWKGELSQAPTNPEYYWAYYNTTTGCSYIYYNSTWNLLAMAGKDGNNSSSGTGNNTASKCYLYVAFNTSKGSYVQCNTQKITDVDFGKITIGDSSSTTAFYIGLPGTNDSTFTLTGNPSIQISGTDADQFMITQPTKKTVNSGTYIQDVCITFTPTTIGTKQATITIPNNSTDKPDFSFTIKGTGSYYPKAFDSGEGDGDDTVTKILTDPLNNMYAIGYGWELANDHSGFDWWIKKFNSVGNQLWEKKFDFYDDNSYSFPVYDYPKYAIFDKSGNLLISSDYNTIKINSSGTKLWELNIGGELFCDSENNIIIGNSKYTSSGILQWTNNLVSKPVFDSDNNLYSVLGNTITKINSDGTYNWANAVIDSTGRFNSNIERNETQLLSYNLSADKHYLLTWDDKYGTTVDEKTGYVFVSANFENSGVSVIPQTNVGYGTYGKTITAENSDNLLVSIKPVYTNIGTYDIAMYQSYSSGNDFASSDWINGTLSTNGLVTYSLSTTKGRPYIVCVNEKGNNGDGSKTADAKVSAEYSDGTSIFSNQDATFNSPKVFFANQTGIVTIKVETYNSSSSSAGSFGIAMKELSYIQPKIAGFNTGITNTISMCMDSYNNIYVTGYEINKTDDYSKKDIIIKKFSSSGSEILTGWNKAIDYGHCNDEVPEKISFDGTYIILQGNGYDSISDSSELDGLFYIYNTTGSVISSFEIPYWDNTTYFSSNFIGNDSSRNYYFLCYDSYYYLVKYNSNGNLLWAKKTDINSPVATLDSNGNIYVGGYGSNLCASNSGQDWYIKKYASNGEEF